MGAVASVHEQWPGLYLRAIPCVGQEQLHNSCSGQTHKSFLKFLGNGEGHWVQRGGSCGA